MRKSFWVALIFAMATGGPTAPAQTNIAVLHSFTNLTTDGYIPEGQPLLIGPTLYGVTFYGGSLTFGSVFQVNTNGSNFNLVHSFEGDLNGANPFGSLVSDGATFYGMTFNGGISDGGVMYRVRTNGTSYAVVHTFLGGNADGLYPYGSLALGGSTLYGMTANGGTNDAGVLFKINTNATGFAVVHSFRGFPTDGSFPSEGVTLGGTNLYGTTFYGGSNDLGTVFSVGTNGSSFKVLHGFGIETNDGVNPSGPLTLDGSVLYGITSFGGFTNRGTVFKINTDGSGYGKLHDFMGGTSDGAFPQFGPLLVTNGSLYGVTENGGLTNRGVVFQMSTNGTGFTVLHSFTGGTNDGAFPFWPPILSSSNFYGMTVNGGSNNVGVVYAPGIATGQPPCTNVPGNASSGVTFTNVVAGQAYSYSASGCVQWGGFNQYADPDGNIFSNNCNLFVSPPIAGPGSFTCPGLRWGSLVGKVGGACVQLGSSGAFVAPASGPLVLYCNDNDYTDNGGLFDVCIEPVICDSNAPPVLTQVTAARIVGNNIVITVPSEVCQTYQLQYSDAMITTTSWTDVDSPQPGTGGFIQFVEPIGGCSTATCVAAPSGLVGWWPGDGNAIDMTSGNNGVLSNGVTFTDGKDCQAFRFDGTNDAVYVGNPANLRMQNFTIEAWLKRNNLTQIAGNSLAGHIFCYGTGGYGFEVFQVGPTNCQLVLTQVDATYVDSGSLQIADLNYHHVAVTKTNSTVVFYVDGVSFIRSYNPGFTFTTPAAIGARGDSLNNNFIWGDIDEVSVYNRVLSAAEVQSIYNAGAAGKCKPQNAQRFYRVREYP